MPGPQPLWTPSPERIRNARLTAFADFLARERGLRFADYDAMWAWSVGDLEAFWSAVWQYFDVRASAPYERVLADARMPGAVWFPGARLNVVDQVFRHAAAGAAAQRPAIVHGNEAGDTGEVSWPELERQVAALATALRRLGVSRGDRVVAYLPNVPQAVVAFLATASIGAIWSMCAADMGPVAVLDRFRQIEPKVLVCCDGYRYGGKAFDRGAVIAELRAQLPTVQHTILLPTLGNVAGAGALDWNELVRGAAGARVVTEQVPFDHPLWVVYSSGTTGLPKPIVHGHGGILLEMVKGMGLQLDIGPDDRFHWFTSTGWIMWNCQIGGLLLGATICLYDGSPAWPDMSPSGRPTGESRNAQREGVPYSALWRFVANTRTTFFGAGAAFYASCGKAGVRPREIADLSALRALGSTGSPLPPEAYRWIYDEVKRDLWLTSISGGTDTAAVFVGGLITVPVYEGEMACRFLGADVQALDEQGRPLLDEVGELVCAKPTPSMPLYFWNDPDGARYRSSYFDMYPGKWRHGDWIRLVPRPGATGAIIYGRSDATINRHGIRMGTSELYRAVETIPEVLDSLVVDLEYLGRESYMPLFVVLRPGVSLTDELKSQIVSRIRTALSPKHVPSEILVVPEIPRTLSGKKMELPVKKLLMGQSIDKVANRDAMANPGSLGWFIDFAKRRG